jgi:hypothetical protein
MGNRIGVGSEAVQSNRAGGTYKSNAAAFCSAVLAWNDCLRSKADGPDVLVDETAKEQATHALVTRITQARRSAAREVC